jgi:hypothetical protein
MKKIKKIFIGLVLACAVGVTYSVYVLKNMPETYDWNLDDE